MLVSSEVWVSYLLAFIFWGNEIIRNTLLTFASACVIFWNLPFTPFLAIVITLTFFVKKISLWQLRERRMHFMSREGVVYNKIFSERPTLNDVFLELTGKELRD